MRILLNKKKVFKAVKCGHKTERRGCLEAYGQKSFVELPLNAEGNVDYCFDCLSEMAIQCAWCKRVIFPGDPITSYGPGYHNFELPKHAVVNSKLPLRLVGCGRSDCAKSKNDIFYFWVAPGLVRIFPNKNIKLQQPIAIIDEKDMFNISYPTL